MKRWYRLMSIVMTAVLAAGSIQVPAFASQAAPDIIIEKIEEDVTAGETVQEAASEAMEMPEDESVLYDSAEIDENAMEDMPEAASYGDTEQEDVEDTEYAVTVHEETAGYEGPAADESGAEEPEKENVGTTENAESDWLETEGTENAGETEDSDTSVTEDPAEGYHNEGSGAEEDDTVEDAGVDETVQENDDTDEAGYEENEAGKEAEEEGFRAEIPEPEAGEKDIPDAETITDDPEAGSVTDIANGSVYDADRALEDSTAIDEESAPGTASAGKEETESSYTVTFHANGGYFISEDGVKEEAVSATAPVGEGILLVSSSEIRNDDPHMVFKGWKETEDSGCIEASPDGLYYSDSDRDVYAAWEREAVYVASITLRENEMTLAVNKEKALKVKEVLPEDADNKGLRWTSSNTKAATVTQKGVVKGVGKGTATITATARDGSGVKASCKVTVKQPVTKVTLNKKTASMMRGKALTLKASVSPKNANNRDIRWTSSNTKAATVTQKGVVKGVGKGTATITAAARDGSGVKASCRVTVKQPVTKVTLNKKTASMMRGKALTLKASVSPKNANNRDIRWTSSNTKAATVTQKGVVKGVGKGTATITAAARDGSGVKASCRVTVKQPVTKVTLNKKTASMMRGKALTLKASVSPKNANNRDIRWTSSNTKVATVTQKGVVKGVGKGTATITAAARDGSRVKASCRITVRQPVAKVILDKNTISIVSGKTSALKASVFPENADSKTIVWTSSDTKVVTVTQQGIVKGIRKGNATITAKAADGSGVKAACQIAVTQPASKGLKEIDSVIFAFDPLEIIRENPITNFVSIILTDTDSTGLDERTGPKTPKAPEAPKKPAAPKSPRPAEEPKAPEPPKKPAVPKTPKPAEEPKAPKTPETVEKPFVPQIPETVEEQPPHTHTWKNMVKTVHHNATGHYEKKQTGTKTVVDEEEWDEEIYGKAVGVCSECGFTSSDPLTMDLHLVFEHHSNASYSVDLVQTGTVHHPAVTHEEPVYERVWVEDKAAWDETIITGQKCIECGATK